MIGVLAISRKETGRSHCEEPKATRQSRAAKPRSRRDCFPPGRPPLADDRPRVAMTAPLPLFDAPRIGNNCNHRLCRLLLFVASAANLQRDFLFRLQPRSNHCSPASGRTRLGAAPSLSTNTPSETVLVLSMQRQ